MASHAHTVDQLLHSFGTCLAHLVDNVAVLVQGERRGVVSHVLLEGLDVVTGFDAVHGERMPEVMDPVMLQAGLLQDLLEFLPDRRLDVVVAVLVAEDQIGEITFIPERAGGEFLRSLDSLVMPENIHDERRREYDPGLSVLQRAPVVFAAAFLTGRGELLESYGASSLKGVPPEKYEELLEAVAPLGAEDGDQDAG